MGRNAPPPAALTPTASPAEQYEAIQSAMERERDKMAVALSASSIPPARFFAVVDQALRRSPSLLSCTPASIIRALLDAAELGLVPSGLLGQAYLVPYRNRRTGRMEAQLIPGYRGLVELARRSGELLRLEARAVRENDQFDYAFGTDNRLTHIPYLNRTGETVVVTAPDGSVVTDQNTGLPVEKPKDGGRYVAVYAIATLTHGQSQVELMTTSEVEAIRRRSKAADDGPWVTDWAEMAKKTAVKKLVKYLPVSIDSPVMRALELEDRAESEAIAPAQVTAGARSKVQALLGVPEAVPESSEPEVEPVPEDVPVPSDA